MVFTLAESNNASAESGVCVIINRGKVLCKTQSPWQPLVSQFALTLGEPAHKHYLGDLDGQACFAYFYDRKDTFDVPGYDWMDLRSQLGLVSDEYFQVAGRALQITRWFHEHQFCGKCGHPTRESSSDRALVCQNCERRFYPRIAPCVIGLVKRDGMCLLARGIRHPAGIYSTLAGFVEPGESAEEAFAREVMEEVSIAVRNIRYFGSQAWPFPGQLMIGFIAEYASGEIQVDEKEIVDAQWFAPDQLPRIPPKSTISGQIVQEFLAQVKQ